MYIQFVTSHRPLCNVLTAWCWHSNPLPIHDVYPLGGVSSGVLCVPKLMIHIHILMAVHTVYNVECVFSR